MVGTLGMVLAHRLARHAAAGPSVWSVTDLARTFGMQPAATRVLRVLDRLHRFDLARRTNTHLAVRLWLPPLTRRQLNHLPAYLRDAYQAR